jgi:hypothetical protein
MFQQTPEPDLEDRYRPYSRFWKHDRIILLSGFFLIIFLIVYIWWPLAKEYLSYIDWNGPWWLHMDWLLIGIFLFMSLTILAQADLRTDVLIVFVGFAGGLAIEAWGTQTNLWFYYTHERPPLWIIPAWPIASLSISRITYVLDLFTQKVEVNIFVPLYWISLISFLILLLVFVAPTFDKPYTILALLCSFVLILSPRDFRLAFLTFIAGSGLGYFLEVWGTTRQCWIYYTNQTPPLAAVLAHGMAALAFWRMGLWLKSQNLKRQPVFTSVARCQSNEP